MPLSPEQWKLFQNNYNSATPKPSGQPQPVAPPSPVPPQDAQQPSAMPGDAEKQQKMELLRRVLASQFQPK